MDRKKIRQYQLSQLWLLEKFDTIARNLGVQYYLVYGTLIGAVRHKGFIPWDADIDIAMHRDEYEKMRQYLITQPIESVFYENYETEEYHISPHALLRILGTHVYFKGAQSCKYALKHNGIYIDIFPIDTLIDDERKQRRQLKEFSIIRKLIILKAALTYGTKTSFIKRISKIIVSNLLGFISFTSLNQLLDNIMKRYSSQESENVVIMTDLKASRCIFPRSCFQAPLMMEFEGKLFPVPTDPDLFLQIHYLDYMKYPPESTRWMFIDNVLDDVDFGDFRYQ